jgi:hypothetical protein
VKIYDFVPGELRDRAYDIWEEGSVFDPMNDELEAFAESYDQKCQIGFDGRNGGYMVLYQGGRYENSQIYSKPGLSTDQDEDFEGWSKPEVLEMYRIVRDFDKVVNKCKKIFIAYCNEFEVVEETVMVPRTVKVLKEVG